MKQMTSGLKAVCALFLYLAIAQAWAANPSGKSTAAFEEVLLDAGIENDLRQLLGSDYGLLKTNFEEIANPVKLKDGGIFVDGWRSGMPNRHAAAIVYYPGKKVYAAYYDEDKGQVFYFGESSRVHPAIQVWAKRFSPPFKLKSQNEDVPNDVVTPQAAADSPSPEEQEELRKVAASIWGESLASGWDMNAEVGDILGTVTNEIMECSAAFSLVPKPVGWVPGWSYVAKTALQIVAYITGVSKDNRYKVCVDAAALNWRSAIEMASAGI